LNNKHNNKIALGRSVTEKKNNKIALRVGWKICCWYLVVTSLRVRCSLSGQCTEKK